MEVHTSDPIVWNLDSLTFLICHSITPKGGGGAEVVAFFMQIENIISLAIRTQTNSDQGKSIWIASTNTMISTQLMISVRVSSIVRNF